MKFAPTTRRGAVFAAIRLVVIMSLIALAGGHWVFYTTAHTNPTTPLPVQFSGAVPDHSYNATRWNLVSVSHSFLRPGTAALRDRFLGDRFSISTAEDQIDRFESEQAAHEFASDLASDPTRQDQRGVLVVNRWNRTDVLEATAGLRRGDVVLTLDGVRVYDVWDAQGFEVRHLGQKVRVGVVRDGKLLTLNGTLPGKHDDLGVDWASGYRAVRPGPSFHVADTRTGGPSGGLLMTLAYLDAETPGDLSGGLRVGGTGTVEPDGTVGDVGSIRAKVQGAAHAGLDVFFVSPFNAAEARAEAARLGTKMPVVEVNTPREAVMWLCARGGQSPACVS